MERIENGSHYHIFNRGINSMPIFLEKEDFVYFLSLIKKYLPAISNIYCYALMRNHFHLLVKIKDESEILYLAPLTPINNKGKWKFLSDDDLNNQNISKVGLRKPEPSRQFSHLFNAYTKKFNHKYARTGSLFEKNFKRVQVENEEYLRHLIYYIHHNPIHHGISMKYHDYQWTSYLDFKEKRPSFIEKSAVADWFGNMENFIDFHQKEHELSLVEDSIIE